MAKMTNLGNSEVLVYITSIWFIYIVYRCIGLSKYYIDVYLSIFTVTLVYVEDT